MPYKVTYLSESAISMLYTDDEIIEYEYEIVDDVEWKDDISESETKADFT